MAVVLEAREDFTLEAFRRVAVDGEDAVLGPAALRVMGAARAGFEQLLRSGHEGFIYGVTTRPGVEVGTTIPPGEWRSYARRFRGPGPLAGTRLTSRRSRNRAGPSSSYRPIRGHSEIWDDIFAPNMQA